MKNAKEIDKIILEMIEISETGKSFIATDDLIFSVDFIGHNLCYHINIIKYDLIYYADYNHGGIFTSLILNNIKKFNADDIAKEIINIVNNPKKTKKWLEMKSFW